MSQFPPPEPDSQNPRPVLPLDYGTGRYERADSHPLRTTGHFCAGIGAWLVMLGAAWIAVGMQADVVAVLLFLIVALSGLLGLGAALSKKYGWKAFTPGVLIGAALTCLTPIGIIAVICGGTRL